MALPQGHDKPTHPQPIPPTGNARQPHFNRGITLLDSLAIAALPVAQLRQQQQRASYIDRPPIMEHGSPAELAKEAYDIAEAMLLERTARLDAGA